MKQQPLNTNRVAVEVSLSNLQSWQHICLGSLYQRQNIHHGETLLTRGRADYFGPLGAAGTSKPVVLQSDTGFTSLAT